MKARQFINASTAPILAGCILAGAALGIADALTSPAAAAPALIVQFTTNEGVSMSKLKEEKVRRPAVAKLATKLVTNGMDRVTAETTAKARLTGRLSTDHITNDSQAKPERAAAGAVFIHGPQGCGKTRNAAALCKLFGKARAVDFEDDKAQSDYAKNLIVFSNIPLPGSIPFRTAMSRAGLKA